MSGDTGQVRTVLIHDLVRDEERFQVRNAMNPKKVEEYAQVLRSGVDMGPVQAVLVDGRTLVLVDGWHRVAAHERNGATRVEARVIEGTERDAQWLAASANLRNGLPLKPREIRNVFRMYVGARKHIRRKGVYKSYREMQKDLGGRINHTTILKWMRKDYPEIAAKIGGAEPNAKGGLQERRKRKTFADEALDALMEARAASRGVRDAEDRGRLIQVAEQLLQEMKEGGVWTPQDDLQFSDF